MRGGVKKSKIEFRSTITNDPASKAQLLYLNQLSLATQTRLRIRIARPYGSAYINGNAVIHPDASNIQLLKDIREMAKANPYLNVDPFLRFDQTADVETGLDCGAGTRSAFIDAHADFYPCGAISAYFPTRHNLLGGTSLLEFWREGKAFTTLREYFDIENHSSPCSSCPFVNACQGGCPSVRLSSGVNKNPLCPRDYLLD